MSKSAIFAGLVLCVPIFLVASPQAHAEVPQQIVVGDSSTVIDGQKVLQVVNAQLEQPQPPVPEEQKPVEHTVAEGETLTKVADKYQTTWQRLFAKNTNISNPDIINVGDKLVIPKADEQLAERVAVSPPAEAPSAPKAKSAPKAAKPIAKQSTARGSSGGNTYTAGYCTWYAKSKRPDLPNNLGNASTWVSRAQAQGIATGSAPRAGAVGQRGNHVVYVESVNGDGSVNVSEMNHVGWNIVSSRTVPGNYFTYIY